MKRLALACLLSGTALAGGGNPAAFDELRPLRGLSGQAFDLAWLDKMLMQQVNPGGLSELESRYGKKAALKNWASADVEARQAVTERLLTLKNEIQRQESRTVPIAIANIDQHSLANMDSFFLTEYAKASAQSVKLARLALSKSQNSKLRLEAASLLVFQQARLNELKTLK